MLVINIEENLFVCPLRAVSKSDAAALAWFLGSRGSDAWATFRIRLLALD